MQAWQVVDTDDATHGLRIAEVPNPADGFVVQVEAAGIGYPDLLMRRGEFQIPQPTPFVLGWEAAGVVVDPGATSFTAGDRVATISFGAFAETVVADPNTTFVLPDSISFAEGAALPLNGFTALAALRRGDVSAGDVVLVHGAAGGVGLVAVQLAKAVGAEVVGVVSTDEKAEVVRRHGADLVITGAEWPAALREAYPLGVDVAIDPVTGDGFTDTLRVLASEGRAVVIGFVGGSVPTVGINRLLFNNTDVRGCSWSVLGGHPGGFAAAAKELTDLVVDGGLELLVSAEVPFAELPSALDALSDRQAIGKQVLAVRS